MGHDVGEVEEEGLVFFLFDEGKGFVGVESSEAFSFWFFDDDLIGFMDGALAAGEGPKGVVESLIAGVEGEAGEFFTASFSASEVPLADHGGLVAFCFEDFWDRDFI